MQQKMLDRMEKIVNGRASHHDVLLDFVNQPQYANTGAVYVQHGLDTIAQVTYRFNDSYATMILTPVTNAQFAAGGNRGQLSRWDGRGLKPDKAKGERVVEFSHLDYANGEWWQTFMAMFSTVVDMKAAELATEE